MNGITLLLLWCSLLSLGTGLAALAMAQDSVERRLVRLEEQLPEFVLRRDTAAIRRIMADDFIGFDPAGRRLTIADVEAQARSTEVELDFLRHEEIEVRVFGRSAVATAITVVKGRHQGHETGGRFRFTHVWVERQGRWQIVAAQSTPLPAEPR